MHGRLPALLSERMRLFDRLKGVRAWMVPTGLLLLVLPVLTGCGDDVGSDAASSPDRMDAGVEWSQLEENLKFSELPERIPSGDGSRFAAIPVEQSGLDFGHEWSPPPGYQLELYNSLPGGGVCIGDINGDDLPDVFLTQPDVGSQLFRNKGGMQFENVTEQAGIGDHQRALGVTFVDVDADGDLDLYVCNREEPNCLYVNRGGRNVSG